MRRPPLSSIVAVSLTLLASPALADERPDPPEPPPSKATPAKKKTQQATPEAQAEGPYVLPPVVVTPKRGQQKAFEASRAVNAVDEARIREVQARSIPDALEDEEGVHVQRTNRGAGAPVIRGLIGPQNLILVDGVRFNLSTYRTGPNQYLALLDPYAIEQLEVVRGPSSVLYGNGAMGGVLQVIMPEPKTAEGEAEIGGRVQGRFASADLSAGGSARLNVATERAAFFLGGTFDHFGTLRAGGGDEIPLSDYDAGYWQAKGAFDPGGDVTLSAAYYGMLMRDAGRTDSLGVGEARLYDNDDHLAYLRFEWEGKGAVRRVQVTASYHHQEELVERYNCSTDDEGIVDNRSACGALDLSVVEKQRKNEDIVDSIGTSALADFSVWDDRLRIQTGLELYYDSVGSTREDASAGDGFTFKPRDRGNFSDGSSWLTLGLYAYPELTLYSLGGETDLELLLTGGVRLSHFSANAPEVPGLGDVDYAFTGLVGTAGLQLLVDDSLNLYAAFIQGFRAPNLQETTVLGDTGSTFEIPNDQLAPERSDTFEIGARAAVDRVELSVIWFYSALTDAIAREPTTLDGQDIIDGKPVTRRVNAAEGTSTGVEGEVAVKFWRFRLSTTAAYMTSDVTDIDGRTQPARRVPPIHGTVKLRYTHPDQGAYGEIGLRYADRQDRLSSSDRSDLRICETAYHSGVRDPACTGTPGFAVLTLRGGWQFHDQVRADLTIDNVLDDTYKLHGSGFPQPGVDARLSVSATF